MRYSSPSVPKYRVPGKHGNALLRLSIKLPGSSNFGSLVSALGLQIHQVDRRPSTNAHPFHDMYFLQVVEAPSGEQGETDDGCWQDILEEALGRASRAGWEGCILGSW